MQIATASLFSETETGRRWKQQMLFNENATLQFKFFGTRVRNLWPNSAKFILNKSIFNVEIIALYFKVTAPGLISGHFSPKLLASHNLTDGILGKGGPLLWYGGLKAKACLQLCLQNGRA